jgi:hypothetical protein
MQGNSFVQQGAVLCSLLDLYSRVTVLYKEYIYCILLLLLLLTVANAWLLLLLLPLLSH